MPPESTATDKTVTVAPPIADQYNALIAGVQLLSVRLAKAEISAPKIYVGDPERKLEARISNSATFLGLPAGFMAQAGLHFEGYHTDEEAPQVSVAIELELLYSSTHAMTPELFEEFQHRNLPLNAWPYFRELLQSSLARTGWPIYTLPAFHSKWNDAKAAASAPTASVDASNSGTATKKARSSKARKRG